MCINGVCGNHTKEKQEFFMKFIGHHINVVSQVDKKYTKNRYLFLDPFSGPGHIICKDSGYDGPTSSIRMAQSMKNFDINCEIVTADKNPEYRTNLDELLTEAKADFIIKNDALDVIPTRKTWDYGMMYIDPPMDKQTILLAEKLMIETALMAPKLDFLLYISATNIKRIRAGSQTKGSPFTFFLQDLIDKIDKKFWVIKRQSGKFQYTFLVGTNYNKWAEWGKEMFYSTNSYKGQLIVNHLNYSENERKFITEGMTQGSF